MIKAHECRSDPRGNITAAQFQDEKYGKGKRVMSPTNTAGKYRCSVCGFEAGTAVVVKKVESQPEKKGKKK